MDARRPCVASGARARPCARADAALPPGRDEHHRARQRELVAARGRARTARRARRRGRHARHRSAPPRSGGSGRSPPTAPSSTRRHPERSGCPCSSTASTSTKPAARCAAAASAGSPSFPNARANAARSAPSTTPIASRGAANHGFSAGDAHSAVDDPPARLEHAPELAQRRHRIGRRHHREPAHDRVERRVGERQRVVEVRLEQRRARRRRRRPAAPPPPAAPRSCRRPVTAAPASASATVSRPLPHPASSTRSAPATAATISAAPKGSSLTARVAPSRSGATR